MANEGAPASLPIRPKSAFVRWAVAAALFVGTAGITYYIVSKPANTPPQYVVSNSLYKAMLVTHAARAGGTANPDTISQLSQAGKLSTDLGRPVFAAQLEQDGWTFAGAAVRKVGEFDAAQFFFKKGAAAVSVFSLPPSAVPQAKDDTTYAVTFSSAPIAGFTKSGGLFCIVGDSSITLDEVKTLLEKHRGELVKS